MDDFRDKNISADPNRLPIVSLLQKLSMKAVHIQCLDESKKLILGANATGFIVKEKGKYVLYTCWHVVTGYDMNDIRLYPPPQKRRFLKVCLQNYISHESGYSVGGIQTVILPLYNEDNIPVWKQNKIDIPNESLNVNNVKVPNLHDVIKLKLPIDLELSEMQYIDEYFHTHRDSPYVGEKVIVVGYPYGYSSLGDETPNAIILTRFVASTRIKDREEEILLDGQGTPGMSGSPIFMEYRNTLLLSGIYTGCIYPDYMSNKEKHSALGVMCDMVNWWRSENDFF